MHEAAMNWVHSHADIEARTILDVGGRNINGSPRHLFDSDADYVVVDLVEHESVDWAGDFLEFDPEDLEFDVVLYLEVAEHTPDWREHMAHAYNMLGVGGQLIITAAGPEREPHSGQDGGPLREGEWYAAIDPDDLFDVINTLDGSECNLHVTEDRTDVRACIWRATDG